MLVHSDAELYALLTVGVLHPSFRPSRTANSTHTDTMHQTFQGLPKPTVVLTGSTLISTMWGAVYSDRFYRAFCPCHVALYSVLWAVMDSYPIRACMYSKSPLYGVPTRYHCLSLVISIRVCTHSSSTRTSKPSPQ